MERLTKPHYAPATSRRDFLANAGSGFGALALGALLAGDGVAAAIKGGNPLAPKQPHFAPKAKSVIWLFMEGGPSHIDLFDPKPELEKLAGQPLPPSFGKVITAMGTSNNALMPSQRTFKRYGQSGQWVSDWYPYIAEHMDDIAVLRSCQADGLNHVGSVCQMNTGSILAGRPSLGSWVQYGLGAANENLPAFVVLTDEKEVIGGPSNWSNGFLPGTYQGTLFRNEGPPILDVVPPGT
ncbi:MAG: DUF1501 domain-containing protein, partial [Bryobacteraceae bacterium]